jgi:hypothetical protein
MGNERAHEDVAQACSEPQSVRITASYHEYSPPFAVEPIIRRMLHTIPEKYLNGLSEIVLTNTAGMSRERRRSVTRSRKRKIRMLDARGLYHPAGQRGSAWIEIFVDNVLKGWEKGWWLRLRFLREGQIGDVFFHEVGHHIHYTVRPEYREKEDVADVWKVKLDRNYRRVQHPLLGLVMRALKLPLGYILNKSLSFERRKRWISQAEFDERMKHFRS